MYERWDAQASFLLFASKYSGAFLIHFWLAPSLYTSKLVTQTSYKKYSILFAKNLCRHLNLIMLIKLGQNLDNAS